MRTDKPPLDLGCARERCTANSVGSASLEDRCRVLVKKCLPAVAESRRVESIAHVESWSVALKQSARVLVQSQRTRLENQQAGPVANI